jgi:hypothetical protein
MFKKIVLSAGGLAAAGLLPYCIATGPSHLNQAWKALGGSGEAAPATVEIAADAMLPPQLLPAEPYAAPLEGAPAQNLAEILRFDVTPDWIMRRWPRVSTGLADLQLHGYRVPLVTGTSEVDLAGSLTYYFNPQQRVQRITFAGSTGNVAQLAQLLTSRFRMARRITNDPSLMIYEAVTRDGKPAGVARIRTAPVVRAGDTFHRYDVQVVIERPEA